MTSLRFYLRYYKYTILWAFFFIVTIILTFGIQTFLDHYNNINPETRGGLAILTIMGISFILIFSIFSFVKIYQKGKLRIESLLDEKSPSFSNLIIFCGVSIIINVNIVLLISSGSLEYIFTVFPQLEIIKDPLGSIETKDINYFFTTSFNRDLIFKFSFSAFGSGVLLLLNNIRRLEIKKKTEKHPGTRLLLIFFLISFLTIIIRTYDNAQESVFNETTVGVTLDVIFLTTIFSLILYFIDSVIFTKLKTRI